MRIKNVMLKKKQIHYTKTIIIQTLQVPKHSKTWCIVFASYHLPHKIILLET